MDGRPRRCGVAAAAAIALLTNVTDVQGFAFTLQPPSKQPTKSGGLMGGGRAVTSTRAVCSRVKAAAPMAVRRSSPSWTARQRTRTSVVRFARKRGKMRVVSEICQVDLRLHDSVFNSQLLFDICHPGVLEAIEQFVSKPDDSIVPTSDQFHVAQGKERHTRF